MNDSEVMEVFLQWLGSVELPPGFSLAEAANTMPGVKYFPRETDTGAKRADSVVFYLDNSDPAGDLNITLSVTWDKQEPGESGSFPKP